MSVVLRMKLENATKVGFDDYKRALATAMGQTVEEYEKANAEILDIQREQFEAAKAHEIANLNMKIKMVSERLAAHRRGVQQEAVADFEAFEKKKVADAKRAADEQKRIDASKKGIEDLRGIVQKLNAMNITPRGYEMFAFRMAGVVQSMGAAAVPLAAIAAGAYTAYSALDKMHKAAVAMSKEGTVDMKGFGDSVHEAASSIGIVLVTATGYAKGGVKELTDEWNRFNTGVESNRGLLEFFQNAKEMANALAGGAGAETLEGIIKSIEEADVLRQKLNDEIRIGIHLKEIDKALASSAFQEEMGRLKERISEEQNGLKLRGEIRDIDEQLRLAAKNDMSGADWERDKNELLARRAVLLARDNELQREEWKIQDKLKEIEKERKKEEEGRDPWRTEQKVKEEMAEQLKIANQVSKTVKEKTEALKKYVDLEKELVAIEKQHGEWIKNNAKLDQAAAEARLKAIQEWQQELAKVQHMRDQMALREEQRLRGDIEKQLGDGGIKGAIGRTDPRLVREAFVKNQMGTLQGNLQGIHDRDLANFSGTDAERANLQRQQKAEMDREMRQARTRGFRDFNSGRVDPAQMQEAQQEAFRGVVGNAQKQGRITQLQANALNQAVQIMQQEDARLEQAEATVRALQNQMNGMAKNARQRAQKTN